MRIYTLLLLFCCFNLHAQYICSLPDQFNKRILLAHPTTSTIEVIETLYQQKLLNTSSIELVGIYHKDENYDYSKSASMLDTLAHLNFSLVELQDTLYADSLFCHNANSQAFQQLFNESEGIIFFGGPDIPPAIYGEKAHPATKVTDPYRHYFEASLLYHLLGGYQNNEYTPLLEENPNYLIFGICLGMQTMNVASGGTLIQDIPTELFDSEETKGLSHLDGEEVHRNFYAKMRKYEKKGLAGSHFHRVRFKDYFFPSLTKSDAELMPLINSYHHQAVENLGKGFVVGATSSDDKVIEAMFHAHYPNVFGVQFHPERSQFFHQTRKYQFAPDTEGKFLNEYLDEESMAFHVRFWQAVNNIIQEL
ncbi:gamma-glutamyl-gamma-aminobutyrate hydrolase family protein [Carboxylicivirga sp. A043]|uniref:gamma-glutamyl-gamma-aminobutyrate hydrolase family protein n=1 Tax=Carboxylicivirga litoralis TaxID=2816963 RepID=UPI0021CB78A7|nr:gamma-glutamyl-gamma-aminobutyrate hydrolase family protein [Carboxylicivirga sp. A043]MCU4157657.1 gamma-glutamyl-gamma-aminobutyrate hydrolase family protein [Carboxylicivirga sp. A043]